MRTAFLIDGFNFYHSIKPLDRKLLWFDYTKYCAHFMRNQDTLHNISYYTALAFWRPDAEKRHKVFIEACKIMGIRVVEGKFKVKPSLCPHCNRAIVRHEEKATDVNIALDAYRMARYVEQVFIVSGDTDLIPAIRAIKQDYPHVRVGVIFPFKRANREIACEVNLSHKTNQKILHNFLLPPSLTKPDGTQITCPAEWT